MPDTLYYREAVLGDNPVGFWPLNGNGNEIYGRYNGTTTGGVSFNTATTVRSRNGDTGATFDGVNGSKIVTANFANYPFGLGGCSFEFWANWTDVTGNLEYLFDTIGGGANNPGFQAQIVSGRPTLAFGGTGTKTSIQTTLTTYNNGNWHHFVAVLQRTGGTTDNVLVYCDNVLDANSGATASVFNITSTLQLTIGTYNNGTTPNNYIGKLQYLAVYNYSLSAKQVANHYACPYDIVPFGTYTPIVNPNAAIAPARQQFYTGRQPEDVGLAVSNGRYDVTQDTITNVIYIDGDLETSDNDSEDAEGDDDNDEDGDGE